MHIEQSLAVKFSVADFADVRSSVSMCFPHVTIKGDLSREGFLTLSADEITALLVHRAYMPFQFALIVEYLLTLSAHIGSWISVNFVTMSIQVHFLVEDVIAAGAPKLTGFLVNGAHVPLQPRRIIKQFAAEVTHVWPGSSVNFVSVSV